MVRPAGQVQFRSPGPQPAGIVPKPLSRGLGHPGNTVINGHRGIHGLVFWDLNEVKRGDKIIVYAGDVAYAYVVTEAHRVRYVGASAEELDEHQQYIGTFPEERLTLLTCAPIGTATHRLYVIAEPLDSEGP